jgi:hypothetical protein
LQDGTSCRGGAGLTLEAVELGEAIFAVPVFSRNAARIARKNAAE